MIVNSRASHDSVVMLDGVSWETYSRLLDERGVRHSPQMAYCDGVLEMMSPGNLHEELAEVLGDFVKLWARRQGLAFVSRGRATVRRSEFDKGIEPDASFLLGDQAKQIARSARPSTEIEAPDLAIEIEVTAPALDKLAIYAALGVLEVWRCDGQQVTVHVLVGDTYRQAKDSLQLPGFPISELPRWLKRRPACDDAQLLNEFEAALAS